MAKNFSSLFHSLLSRSSSVLFCSFVSACTRSRSVNSTRVPLSLSLLQEIEPVKAHLQTDSSTCFIPTYSPCASWSTLLQFFNFSLGRGTIFRPLLQKHSWHKWRLFRVKFQVQGDRGKNGHTFHTRPNAPSVGMTLPSKGISFCARTRHLQRTHEMYNSVCVDCERHFGCRVKRNIRSHTHTVVQWV